MTYKQGEVNARVADQHTFALNAGLHIIKLSLIDWSMKIYKVNPRHCMLWNTTPNYDKACFLKNKGILRTEPQHCYHNYQNAYFLGITS